VPPFLNASDSHGTQQVSSISFSRAADVTDSFTSPLKLSNLLGNVLLWGTIKLFTADTSETYHCLNSGGELLMLLSSRWLLFSRHSRSFNFTAVDATAPSRLTAAH